MFRDLLCARGFVLWLCLALALMPVRRALAEPDHRDAQALFRTGLEHSKSGRWGEAVDAFARSRALSERPSVVQNLAVALAHVGRYAEALTEIDRYMALTAEKPNEKVRGELESLRSEIEGKVAVLRLGVSPREAELHIDGILLPREPEGQYTLRLDPGRHAVRVTAEGHRERSFQLVTSAGASLNESVALDVLEAAPALPAVTLPEQPLRDEAPKFAPPSPRPRRLRITGYALVSAGVATLVPGTYYLVKQDNLFDACDGCQNPDIKHYQRIANVLMFTGGAMVGTGAIVAIMGHVRASERTELALGPTSLTLRTRF